MDDDRPGDQLGGRKPAQSHVERVKDGGLGVGDKGHAQEQVGVPERNVPAAQDLRGIGAVGVKVGKGVDADHNAIGQSDVAVEGQDKQAEQGDAGDVDPG